MKFYDTLLFSCPLFWEQSTSIRVGFFMPSSGLIKGKARQGAGLTQQDDVFRPGLCLRPSALRIAEGTAVDALIVLGHP